VVKGVRRTGIFVLKLALSIVLVYLIIARTGLSGIADSLRTVGPSLGAALALALLFTFLKVLKWHRLVAAAAGGGSSLSDAAKSYLVGMAGGLLTPGRVGEIARAVFLERHERGLIAYLVVVDRVFEVAAVVLLAVPGIVFYANPLAGAAAAILLGLLWILLVWPDFPLRWLQRLLPRSSGFAALREKAARMTLQLRSVSAGVKRRQTGLALLGYGVVILQFHALLDNYHPSRLGTAVLAQPLIMLTNILPFTIGGLGIREGAAIALLSPFGVPRAPAVSSALMLFFMNTALPALAGSVLLLLFRSRRHGR